jgi:HK97 family phage major capsid protein
VNELKDKLVALLLKAKAIVEAAEKDGDRAFTAEERQSVAVIENEAKALRDQIKQKQSDAEIMASIQALGAGLENGSGAERKSELIVPGKGKTLGEQFAESLEFKAWMKQVAPGGEIPDSAKGLNSPPVQIKSVITGLSDTSAGALIVNDRFSDVTTFLRRELSMRDIVTVATTGSDAIDWVTINAETNNAAVVAEATSQSDGTKPESTFTFLKSTETVKTIAHWLAATKRSLSDAGQLRALIDNFLRDGLNQALETSMVTGAGGTDFTGLFNISGIQTQAFSSNLTDTYRKAQTLVRTVGKDTANAYLMNPVDWEALDLLTDNEKRYYYGGPGGIGVPMLWGKPVVQVDAITAGTAFVGNFKQLVLFDREQATISVSDSHSDFFIKNLVAILAELRAMFLCRRPKSIVKIALS